MANELKVRIEQVSREKNLDPEVVIRAIEDAILQLSLIHISEPTRPY